MNAAADGSDAGVWLSRQSLAGPLLSGAEVAKFPVGDLEGRHQVRVVVPGALSSPLTLGTLLLDRTPPVATGVTVASAPDRFDVRWTQSDGGLSGTDPAVPLVAEVNSSPVGDGAGAWEPLLVQPAGQGDGPKLASHPRGAVSEGVHLARVRSTDVAGNTGAASLGLVVNDNRPPVVTARIARAPRHGEPSFEIRYTASDPQPGSGLDPGAGVALTTPGGLSPPLTTAPLVLAGEGRISGALPGPGTYRLAVRVADRAGLVGESAPFELVLPLQPAPPPAPPAELQLPMPDPITLLEPTRARPALARSTRWAFASARRFHARRGATVRARVGAASNQRQWRQLLGTNRAGRYTGYSTFSGEVLLGPSVTAGLRDLHRARLRLARNARGPGSRLPSRLELDRMASALAVLLHETLHSSGPAAVADYRTTVSGRALEEGVTEAVTVDLLPRYVRSLGGNTRLSRALLAAAGRYRPAYPSQVATVRRLSTVATGARPMSAEARRWRVMVADRWGTDRWPRLARATGRTEPELRALWRDPVVARR